MNMYEKLTEVFQDTNVFHHEVLGDVKDEACLQERCQSCNDKIGTGARFILTESIQKINRDAPDSPEIQILDVTENAVYCSDSHANEELRGYLDGYHARLTGGSVKTVDLCGICLEDFDTGEWHVAVTKTVQQVHPDGGETQDMTHPVRFCPECVKLPEDTQLRGMLVDNYMRVPLQPRLKWSIVN